MTLGEASHEQIAYENQFRRANWEAGQIDYLGQDSFDNILKKIQKTIEQPPAEVTQERERRSKTPEIIVPASVQEVQAPAPVAQKPAPVAEQAAAPAPVAQKPATASESKEASPAPAKKKEEKRKRK